MAPVREPIGASSGSSPREDDLGAPYPIRRKFYARVLPGIAILALALLATTVLAARGVVEHVYLRLATERAASIAEGVRRAAPQPWEHLLAGAPLSAGDREALAAAFADEQQEFKLPDLKVYDTAGRTIYAADPAKIGVVESGAALQEVLSEQQPSAVAHQETPDAPLLYELYVPYFSGDRLAAVIELYEPAGQLDAVLRQVAWPVGLVLALFLGLLLVSLAVVVGRAQRDIDARTRMISALRQRLESLVSQHAIAAVRHPPEEGEGRPPTQALETTLFYSDVRGFTGFSERHAPEEVIATLNKLMALQVEIIESLGGDVDKMIGDAVLARFDDGGRERRALEAAQAVQSALRGRGELPFEVGIGVYSGQVVAGFMGSGGRLDYTIVGDSVNVAARLCALAGAGEIVADAATVKAAGLDGFGASETVTVRGRAQPLAVRRASAGASAPMAGPGGP